MKLISTQSPIIVLLLFIVNNCYSQTIDFTYTTSNTPVACTPQQVIFTATYSGTPTAFLWNFGNRQRGSNATEQVIYDEAGTYNVVLTVIYNDRAISTTKTVLINASPLVNLTVDKTELCTPGTVVFSIDGSTNISTYSWNFGDESQLQTNAPGDVSHRYANYGNYKATVKAVTAAGCTVSTEQFINVSKFSINATVVPNSGCIPATATLGVTTQLPRGDRATSFSWDLNDGSPLISGTDSSITHVYNTTNPIENANVTVNTQDGCTNRFVFAPFAYGTPPANTTIRTQLVKDSFCASEPIRFIVKASNANEYKIDFDDSTGTTVTDTILTHKFRLLGEKTVVVTPYFNGCEGEKDSITIFIKGVIAEYSYSNQCSNKNVYDFVNTSKGNISKFRWTFNDGHTSQDSVEFEPSYTFPVYATSYTSLYLYDSITTCSDEINFNIYTAVPTIRRSTDNICKDDSINYTISSSYPDSAGYTYQFYTAGDSISNGGDSILNFRPSKHGNFADYVVISDALRGTCDDTLRLSNITVRGPIADFSTQDRLCQERGGFNFTNTSYPFYNTDAITVWEWDFGDSTKTQVRDAEPHDYEIQGAYNIRLTATDINGCSAYMEKEVISYRNPQVIVLPSKDTICGGRDSVMLSAYTTDTLLWMPTSNINCVSCDTTYVFPTNSTYYIASAKNRFGCMSYDTAYIKVYNPFNLNILPGDTSVCQGEKVQFNLDYTEGHIQWMPAGLLNNTGVANPVAAIYADTSFTAVVTDSAGCYTDTAITTVHIYQQPSVNAGEDKMLPYGSAFTINPVYSANIASYTWTPATNLNCSNCSNPTGTALQNNTYTVQVVSANGCKASDKITVAIQCDNGNLTMPTAFSPNGNGINEYFYPIAKGYKVVRKFVIFNRLGNKVFERQNFQPNVQNLGWNGINRGAETVTGNETFVWFMEAECYQGEVITSKGTVTLVR